MEQRKTRQRRVEILKSAAAAFRRRGYHGASMGEIAQALHTTKGSLYYYFKNKEEILFACHQYSLDRLMELIDEVDHSGLSAEHREIIDLVYYHERSVEEVAAIVGIPANTVKTRMFYARKRLAELLQAAGVDRGWP